MRVQRVRGRGSNGGYGRKETDGKLSRRDRIRMAQLLICLLLFLTVFVGRGVFPQRVETVGGQILTLIGGNTDIRGALETLGAALSEGEKPLSELGKFCVAVFAPQGGESQPAAAAFSAVSSYRKQEVRFLSSGADSSLQSAHLLRLEEMPKQWASVLPERREESETEEEETVAAVGTVVLRAEYSGPELPEKYTMDQLSFGTLATMAPLKGTVHSGYGYRDHPINGKYSFHGGLDIGGQKGDPVAAFAAGTVEYIGENDTYGLYLQLDHGNGVKSFYAHCSKLYVSKGQAVAMGDRIAAVGSTGSATGPHLHFELKCGGIHVDPAYYL